LVKKAGVLKYFRYFFTLTIIALVIISIFASQGQVTYAIQMNGAEYGMKIDPEGQLFNTSGLAPGRSDSDSLTVTNEGQKSFTYDIKVIANDQENILYQALDFQVKKGNSTLFNGKLKDLEIVLGTLAPGTSETLNFTLELPKESGNESESQGADFEFVISAAGVNDPGGNDDNGDSYVQSTEVVTPEEENVVVPDQSAESPDIPQEQDVKMPATGVASTIPYYAAGSVVVLAGLLLIRKKR